MERYYIFFRCWEHFWADFPFEKFSDLPDDDINDALEKYAVSWRREHKAEFDRRVRERNKQLIAALKAKEKQRTSRPDAPSRHPRRAEPIRLEPGPECSLGCRNAYKLGWLTTMLRQFGDSSPTPQKFFIHAPSKELATALVNRLTTQWPASIVPTGDDWREYLTLNLRFGYRSASQLGVERQASAEIAINEMVESKRSDWVEELQKSCAKEAASFGNTMLDILKPEDKLPKARSDAEPARNDADNGWPPSNHVAVSTIEQAPKYLKDGKNPPRTTIQGWEKTEHVTKNYDPQSGEVAYPREWVARRWDAWSPHPPKRNTPTYT